MWFTMEAPSEQNGALLAGLEEEGGAHTALIEALLNVVSRAHALCAELQRLSRRVSPLLFTSDFYDKYKDVLFDFEYLKAPEHFEDQVERSLELLELSDSLRDDHLPVMKRYFSLFEHLVLYHQDLIQIAQDLDRGVYIQSTLEGLLQDKEGKQLADCHTLSNYTSGPISEIHKFRSEFGFSQAFAREI